MSVLAGDEAPGHEAAGLEQLTFPQVFGDDGQIFNPGGVTQALPYLHTYTVVATQSLAVNRSVQAVDRAGNVGHNPLFRVAQDAGGPQLSASGLAASVNDPGYVYLATGGPALYYAPVAGGELGVTVTATDTQSGLKSLTFPDVFAAGDGDERSLAGQHRPETFQHIYPFLGSQVVSDTFVMSATDQVDASGLAQPFRVVQDALTPTTAITVPSVAALEFQVAWAGQDSESGVRGYDVQYWDALTPTWIAWLSGTAETQAPFNGERGRSYYFQVRATDNVNNESGWVEAGPVVTHTYPATGTYTAVVTAGNSANTMTATTVVTITPPTCWARLNDDPTDYYTLQAAVDASTGPGDVVKVAGYCTAVNSYGGLAQVAYINKTLTVQGGYTNTLTGTGWTTPDPVNNPTTLDARGQGRVLYVTGNITASIEGLRLTGGDAAGLGGLPWGDAGGGVYLITATATLSNNQVFSNSAQYGAGVCLESGALALHQATLSGNSAGHGAGLYLSQSSATLSGNSVVDNSATSRGGGVYLRYSTATLTGNTLSGNSAEDGGGLYLVYNGDVTLEGNTLSANSASHMGGGVYLAQNGAATLNANQVISNTATAGGGLYTAYNSDVLLTNNLVAGNQASAGSGLSVWDDSPRLLHTTLAGNGGGSGIQVASGGTAALTNTLLVSHTLGISVTGGSTVTLAATLWGSGAWANGADWGGAGTILTGSINLWEAPGFLDPAHGDYHLASTSAAIDRGLDAGVHSDIDGQPRPQGLGYDLGADEALAVPHLSLSKIGPAAAAAGEVFTYTLTVTNSGSVTATNLVVTDTIPAGAGYVSGGTQGDSVVSWTLPSLAGSGAVSVTFAVTATTTITNADYRVTAEGGISATGQVPVTTLIRDWHLITTTLSPAVAGEHAMAYDGARGVVLLYGGNATGYPYENSTWEFDGSDWAVITTTNSPSARYGAAMAYDSTRGVAVLFGGSDETDTALAGTWEYSGTDWVEVSPATSPLSRTYASMVGDPISGTLYLFGGNDGETYYDDLWAYQAGSWGAITPTGGSPPARTLAALAYDSDNDRLLLFGGRSVTGTLLADLWSFDLAASSWIELTDPGGGPPARQAHTLTYDPDTQSLILVGGVTGNGDTLLGDTWHYRGQAGWVESNPGMALPPRAYHQAVYESATQTLVLFSNGEVWRYE